MPLRPATHKDSLFDELPGDATESMDWHWTQFEPYYTNLIERPLRPDNAGRWLSDWTGLIDWISEIYARLNLANNIDTTDLQAEARYHRFLEEIYPVSQSANQDLKQKLLASGIEPQGFEIPLLKMRAEAAIYRQENLPLLTKERKLSTQFNKISGAQTVIWQGEELTLQQLDRFIQSPDMKMRERAWRMASARMLSDREALNQLWVEFMQLRAQLAKNAAFEDYRAYRWQQMLRLDYEPDDCLQFQRAIEQIAVPAASRIYRQHQQDLKVETLRPWDLDQDLFPLTFPPLPPYGDSSDLQSACERIFRQVDPQFGEYFQLMRSEHLLDLDNRAGKSPGAYCTSFPVVHRPFIFMNAVGLPVDLRTLLHESGHAFHNFARFHLPYAQQRIPGLEFAEVASMATELLAYPYLSSDLGGLYSTVEVKKFQSSHLKRILTFWPYMAVVDAFQHWVYSHQDDAIDPSNCDRRWMELWEQFIPGVDWSGLQDSVATGWHRKPHIFRYPFYYVEYGLAQLGAVQIWQNALQDQQGALGAFKRALSLGGTTSLPDLYRAAGARLAFDADTLASATEFIEAYIKLLESDSNK